jgi:hypothetical protein
MSWMCFAEGFARTGTRPSDMQPAGLYMRPSLFASPAGGRKEHCQVGAALQSNRCRHRVSGNCLPSCQRHETNKPHVTAWMPSTNTAHAVACHGRGQFQELPPPLPRIAARDTDAALCCRA